MRAYIIRRLLLMIPTMLLVSLIVFFSVRFIPGNVVEMMMAEMADEAMSGAEQEEAEKALRHNMGLDVPVHVQYGRWMGFVPREDGSLKGILQGDLGTSLWRKTSVTEELFQRLPVTVELGFFALLTALVIALPIGVYSAIRQDTKSDYLGRTFAILCISLPGFWLGTMVMVYPSIWWGWAPAMEYIQIYKNPLGNFIQFVLPGFLMGMVTSGGTMRITRTMMLEVLRQDYIRTAWSKGLSERTVILRHALKNALIPVVTVVGIQMEALVGGTVVIETIFSLPGVGRLLVDALNKRDYPIISAINLFLGSVVLTMNLLIDLTYGYLDPRVKYK